MEILSLKGSEQPFSGAAVKFLRDVLILLADLERGMNAERVAEARASRTLRSKAGQQVVGRPRTALVPAKVAEVRKLKAKGRTVAEIAKFAEISRASVYRALAD